MIRQEEVGVFGSLGYRLFIVNNEGKRISPWHSIPLFPTATATTTQPSTMKKEEHKYIVNMIVEMPRGTTHKMEINKEEPFNPITQDKTKKGTPRHILYGPILHHYGSIPQTFEDPTQQNGDNDPVDIIDIGTTTPTPTKRGSVKKVKVLGGLALIDGDEIDWKIIGIDINDKMFGSQLNDVSDVEKFKPGVINRIREWYRVYKIAEGKKENKYLFDGKVQNRDKAMNVLEESHQSWKLLVKKSKSTKSKFWFSDH